MLEVWKDRDRFVGLPPVEIRRILRAIAENRIRNAVDRESAQKRTIRAALPAQRASAGDSMGWEGLGLAASTTPSRIAIHHEEAEVMRRALDSVDSDVRDVVYLRLFEDYTSQQVAESLGIGLSAAQHRFRKGAEQYRRKLAEIFTTLGRGAAPDMRASWCPP